MNRMAWCVLTGMLALVTAAAIAADLPSRKPSFTIGDNPYPVGGGATAPRPQPAPRQPAATRPPIGDNPSATGKGTGQPKFVYPYSPYGYGYGYYPHRDYYPIYPYYPGPVVLPAESLYGPEAVKRFMGADRMNQPRATVTPRSRIAGNRGTDGDDTRPQRGAGPDARNTAWRFMTLGDVHFSNGKYVEAYERYKKAAEASPAMAEPLFRQGFALLAAGRYELSAKAFKKGLQIDPAWPKSNWRLDELYAKNQTAKTDNMEALAQAAGDKPNNVDLMFLVGLFLHFDGKPDRAAPFFQRAVQLDNGEHVRAFLGAAPEKLNPGGQPAAKP